MDHSDVNEELLSETTGGEAEAVNEPRLVPVAESIRYRKRAQAAEKQNEDLLKQLAEIDGKTSEMRDKLGELEFENKLSKKLVAAGTVDLEAAVLMAKVKSEGKAEADMDSVIDQLKREKQYLFDEQRSAGMMSRKTAVVKGRGETGRSVVERAARKAAVSGNRTDLQEYLKLRRNFV